MIKVQLMPEKLEQSKATWLDSEGKLKFKKRDSDAGYDIYTDEVNPILLGPGQSHVFTTGIRIEVPSSFDYVFRERSSTGKISMAIRAGVFESTYRGELLVLINNTGDCPLLIGPDIEIEKISSVLRGVYKNYSTSKGICQLILIEHMHQEVELATELSTTERGEGRFGSSKK